MEENLSFDDKESYDLCLFFQASWETKPEEREKINAKKINSQE